MTDQDSFCAIGATILVLLAFSGSYITALAAVAWQVHHAAMSWSLLVLLQLTVLICLLSICASETNSLRDSRCFLLFCQAPASSRRCCCSIHAYIHTYMHTYIHPFIHTYIHAYIHTCMHTCIRTQLTHTGLYVDVIAKELALSEATWCYWISVFSVVCLAGLLFGCKSFTWLHTPILHHLFFISCFPMPSLPFFCCLLEEVDMWGYPVLLLGSQFPSGFSVKDQLNMVEDGWWWLMTE